MHYKLPVIFNDVCITMFSLTIFLTDCWNPDLDLTVPGRDDVFIYPELEWALKSFIFLGRVKLLPGVISFMSSFPIQLPSDSFSSRIILSFNRALSKKSHFSFCSCLCRYCSNDDWTTAGYEYILVDLSPTILAKSFWCGLHLARI